MSTGAVTIYAAGGPTIGHGHVMRTLAVARALSQRGCTIRCIADNMDVMQIVRENGFAAVFVDDGLTHLAALKTAEHIFVDSYRVTEQWLASCSGAGNSIALFDDGCRLQRYDASIVIDASPGASNLGYTGGPGTRFLLGPAYFPLRDNLVGRSTDRRRDRIVVTFGGSDPDDASARIFEILSGYNSCYPVTLILGGSYRGQLTNGELGKILIVSAPQDMADHYDQAALAIAGAGQTALELAYFGVPSILLQLSVDQAEIAAGLAREGAAIDCGDYRVCTDVRIRENLELLSRDTGKRQAMSEAGKRLIDGRGAERIADALISAWFGPQT